MNGGASILLGVYGIYILAVVIAGNGKQLVDSVNDDAKDFLPWLTGVVLVAALYANDKTKPAAAPIAALLLLNVILRNWNTIAEQTQIILSGGNKK